MAGFMMPSILAAFWVIGNRKVEPSLTCWVNGATSTPLALNAAAALSVASLMAGNTTAFDATTSWHAEDARYSTHLTVAVLFFVPAQIESARPLNIEAFLLSGPTGVGAMPRL